MSASRWEVGGLGKAESVRNDVTWWRRATANTRPEIDQVITVSELRVQVTGKHEEGGDE